jgi:hypothetical protein
MTEFVGPPKPESITPWIEVIRNGMELLNAVNTMQILLFLGGLFVLALLAWGQFDSSGFDLRDMVCNRGKDGNNIVDPEKMLLTGVFLGSTWLVLYMGIKGNLPEWLFTIWIASFAGTRIGSIVAKVWARKNGVDVEDSSGQTTPKSPG